MLIYHEIIYDAVMKRHLRPVFPFWKVKGAKSPLSNVPAYRYQQSLIRCIRPTCQDVSTAEKEN